MSDIVSINDNVLNSVKKMIGVNLNDDYFDPELIIYINSILVIVYQLGITDSVKEINSDTTWSEIVDQDEKRFNIVKSYIAQKVKMKFDTPSGSVKDVLTEDIKEQEWRMTIIHDEIVEENQNGV